MIYTPLTKRAMKIAYEAHRNQLDKSGIPYIFHPIHLAEQCTDEKTCAAALLHDVIEDCEGYTVERLRKMEIPEDVLEALKLLTHDEKIPYLDYINQLKDNEIARKVKLLDLSHNMDSARLDADIPEDVYARLENKRKLYREAEKILSQERER